MSQTRGPNYNKLFHSCYQYVVRICPLRCCWLLITTTVLRSLRDEPALHPVLLLQLLQLLHVLLQLHVDHLDLLPVPQLLIELHLQAFGLLLNSTGG